MQVIDFIMIGIWLQKGYFLQHMESVVAVTSFPNCPLDGEAYNLVQAVNYRLLHAQAFQV